MRKRTTQVRITQPAAEQLRKAAARLGLYQPRGMGAIRHDGNAAALIENIAAAIELNQEQAIHLLLQLVSIEQSPGRPPARRNEHTEEQ